MKIQLLKNRSKSGYATFGSTYGAGEVPSDSSFCLINENGEKIDAQSRVTAIWPDGSIKWAAHTVSADALGTSGEILPVCKGKKENESTRSNYCTKRKLTVDELDKKIVIDTGKIRVSIEKAKGDNCGWEWNVIDENSNTTKLVPVLQLEEKSFNEEEQIKISKVIGYTGKIEQVRVLESGPLQAVMQIDGRHISINEAGSYMPFQIFLYANKDSSELRLTYTLFYDGQPDRDYLKGFGLKMIGNLYGNSARRYVQYKTDKGCFKEAATLMFSSHPKLEEDFYRRQMAGDLTKKDFDNNDVMYVLSHTPTWNDFIVEQDSSYHYRIRKRTDENYCFLNCQEGEKSNGVVSVNGENGGIILGIRDLWKKNPACIEVRGLADFQTDVTAWFYSPYSESYDFRHYDNKSYQDTLYEGFKHVDSDPRGIAVTSECRALFHILDMVTEKDIDEFDDRLNSPPVYVAAPEYYHEKRAFGYWSLPSNENDVMMMIEDDLYKAFSFYKNEVGARNWYGLFDYGDVMHKYDLVRHTWRYDMGGFAWQNTELVPTYLLWIGFLRTGNSDVFDMAEAMTRHCSEVDMYHLGKRKGTGTRHNVRHWGCSCKEPRIAMAGHHRFYYYLTGDYRIGEVLRESADADKVMLLSKMPIEDVSGNRMDKLPVRSGPDWTSFLANWMTEYERTGNEYYLDKIINGVEDIAGMPFGLASGPEYLLDVDTGHLEYTGEHEDSINMHLQVCQGGTQIWLELLDVLKATKKGDVTLRKLLMDYGMFYMMTKEEKKEVTGGKIFERPFSFPFFASGLAAFSALEKLDDKLARKVIVKILCALYSEDNLEGFVPSDYRILPDGTRLQEISWISTNFVSQWGINIIVVMQFLKEYFPDTISELKKILHVNIKENFHTA